MRTKTNQFKATKPIKAQTVEEKLVDVKTFGQQLEQCGGLSQEQMATVRGWILKNLQKADELFYTRIGAKKNEYVFVEAIVSDLLIHPATYFEKWPALNLKQQKQEIINLNQKAKDLDRWLQNISSNVAMLYENRPETVESYLMHLQNLINQIKNNTEFFGHNLLENPFFPLVKNWIYKLNEAYPQEKILNRFTALDRVKSFIIQSVECVNQDPIKEATNPVDIQVSTNAKEQFKYCSVDEQIEVANLEQTQKAQDNFVDKGFISSNEYDGNSVQPIDPLLSTIEGCLEPLKSLLCEKDFKILVAAKKQYFETDAFPKLQEKIKFKRVNKKKVAWTLSQLFRAVKPTSPLAIEYVAFGFKNLSVFEKDKFTKENFKKSSLYNYYTTNSSKL